MICEIELYQNLVPKTTGSCMKSVKEAMKTKLSHSGTVADARISLWCLCIRTRKHLILDLAIWRY